MGRLNVALRLLALGNEGQRCDAGCAEIQICDQSSGEWAGTYHSKRSFRSSYMRRSISCSILTVCSS